MKKIRLSKRKRYMTQRELFLRRKALSRQLFESILMKSNSELARELGVTQGRVCQLLYEFHTKEEVKRQRRRKTANKHWSKWVELDRRDAVRMRYEYLNFKWCRCCGSHFPRNFDYFYNSNHNEDGYLDWCKSCRDKHVRDAERKNKYTSKYRSDFARYHLFVDKLPPMDKIRRDPKDSTFIQVRCSYNKCNIWYRPSQGQAYARYYGLRAVGYGNRFYCSDVCKNKCEIYNNRDVLFNCKICNSEATGSSMQRYCAGCGPKRKNFSNKIRKKIIKRDLDFNRIVSNDIFDLHHLLAVVEFPEHANEIWNGICLTNHKKLHRNCGVAYKDVVCGIDTTYWIWAIEKLLENKAPKEIVEFAIRLQESDCE